MENNVKKNRKLKLAFTLIILSNCVFQVLGILRAISLYDTTKWAVAVNLLISLFLFFQMVQKTDQIRMNNFEAVLLIFPILSMGIGFLFNGINRDFFSDTYNSIFFIMLWIFVRNSNFRLSKSDLLKYANWMFYALLIFTMINELVPLFGFKVFSIGRTSIFFVFPTFVFLAYRKRLKFVLHLLLLIFATKRGVLLSLLIALLIYSIENRKVNKWVRVGIFTFLAGISISLIIFTLTPEQIMVMPEALQPFFSKMMIINPFSEYNMITSDVRVMEIIYATKPYVDAPLKLIFGLGQGYQYGFYDLNGVLIFAARHNVHFSPVTFLTRYGIIYTGILYFYILLSIFRSIKRLKYKKLCLEDEIFMLYAIAALVNSFTAFTLYIDYLFIFSLAILSMKVKNVLE